MIRVAVAAAVAALIVVAAPGVAHADAAGPTDYRTEIVAIVPPTPAIEVTIEGGDSFVRIGVDPGHELVVLGYLPDEEPYLRIRPDGTIEHNIRSFATYYNEERYGGGDIPDIVDTTADPVWEEIGTGGAWAWHDHRAHWMSEQPPLGLEPGESLPSDRIPIIVDGEQVGIEVVTTLQPAPSRWPAVFGLLVGLQVALIGALLGPAVTTLGALALSAAALAVGLGQYLSVPSETGPLVTWWLLPAIALACAITTVAVYGRSVLVQHALVALAGGQLLLWAVRRRAVLSRPVLPTDLPFWFDRATTAAVLVGAAVIVAMTLRSLLRPA